MPDVLGKGKPARVFTPAMKPFYEINRDTSYKRLNYKGFIAMRQGFERLTTRLKPVVIVSDNESKYQ
jgi:hypothetical protein